MKLTSKISTYTLVTATGLALSLSALPAQMSAINLVGQTNTGSAILLNFKGQTLDFKVGGDFVGTTRPGVTLNSIKFALNSTATGLTAKSFVANIFDTTSGNPTFPALNTGAGALVTSDNAVAVNADGSFTSGALSYILLTFSGVNATTQLDTSKKYGIFLNLAGNTTGFTTSNVALRGTTTDLYNTGSSSNEGQGFRENPANTLVSFGDAAFIVDATPVPFEFEASGGVAILGGLFLANKLRNRKQNDKSDEQA